MLVCYYNNKTEVIREISGYRRYPGIDKRNDITGSEEVPDTITHLRLNMLSLNVRESKLPYFWHGLTSRGLCCLTFVISDTCDRYDGMISVDSFSMHAKDNYFPMFNNIYDWEMDKHKYMPRQVHVICAVFRSRQVIKNIQQVIDNIKADPSYRDLSEKLLSLVPGSASFNHIASIGLQISQAASMHLGKIDKQSIGTIVCNFLCANGDFAKAGVKPIGICTRNVDFHIELATEKKQLQSNRNVTVLPLNEDIIMPNNMVPM